MKKSLILFICFLFSLSLIFSCSSFRMKTESEKAKKTGNIAGIVFDVVTMEPLAGVVVYAEGMTTIGTKTDTLGRFWLSAVPVGEYVFWAKKIPFHGTRVSNLKIVKDSTSIVVCDLAPSAIPEHQSRWYIWQEIRAKCDSTEFYSYYYKTLLRKKETGNVAGIVFDIQTMQPLSGVNVYVEGMTTIGTKTDTLGRFWLYSIPIGEYSVQASHIGFYTGRIPDVKVYDDSTSIVLFNLVTMAIPERPHWYSWQEKKVKCDSTEFYSTYYKTLLRKKKTGNIAGMVFDVQTMQPLSGANVYAEGITTIGTKTDTLGRFWLSAVPVGVYKILAEKIYYHRGEIREVKVYNDSTSIVTARLIINTIEPWGYMIDWDGRIIKADSISFFSTQYKNLLRKE